MRLASLLPLALLPAFAQSPTFDVASVKPSPTDKGDSIQINLGSFRHGVVTLTNTTLSECVQYAYGLVGEDQIEGPDWIRDRNLRVDIIAKTSPGTPLDQALLMTQSLLAERFRMQVHREPKPVRHLELTVGKKGPKLPVSPDDTASRPTDLSRGRLFYYHRPMHIFAVLLSRQLRQPVLDLTGLTGIYDFHLEWVPDDPPGAAATDSSPLPDIYRAVEQQLGLHLESKKTPIDIIVVDRADRVPIAN
jgi:uncharacterized protein (TIGR03435 family)